MPANITTIEFRFDRDGDSKDGMLFQGPLELLQLPKDGESFDLDRPLGIKGYVDHREVVVSGKFTEVILHCSRRGRFHMFRQKHD